MKLSEYLLSTKQKPTPWAEENKIGSVIVLRFLHGTRGLSAETMARIVEATGGQVTFEDLVAEMRELREIKGRGRRAPARK